VRWGLLRVKARALWLEADCEHRVDAAVAARRCILSPRAWGAADPRRPAPFGGEWQCLGG